MITAVIISTVVGKWHSYEMPRLPTDSPPVVISYHLEKSKKSRTCLESISDFNPKTGLYELRKISKVDLKLCTK